ncbi:MAG: hypothetical protein LH606_05230, partial [Cytophagaceae bacterium]|nr:hypothetical protein [Cytophagaceae bacterium]
MKAALSFILCLLAGLAPAQPPPAPPYRVRHLTIQDGLPQGTVYFMHQDASGFVWLGTTDGIARYDGLRHSKVGHDYGSEHGSFYGFFGTRREWFFRRLIMLECISFTKVKKV